MAKVDLAGIFGVIFSFVLIVAPIDTMVRIKRSNGVGQRSVYNYVFTFANAVVLVGYAAPWEGHASTRGWFIAGINGFAIIVEFVYTLFYYHYAQGQAKRIAGWAMVSEAVWAVAMVIVYFAAFYPNRNDHVRIIFFGVFAGVTGCIMYLAMIPDMCSGPKTWPNRASLLLLAALGNCTSWMFFSLSPLSLYVLVPNSVGIVMEAGQSAVWVFVWIMYRNVVPPPQEQQQNGLVLVAA